MQRHSQTHSAQAAQAVSSGAVSSGQVTAGVGTVCAGLPVSSEAPRSKVQTRAPAKEPPAPPAAAGRIAVVTSGLVAERGSR